MGRQGCLCRLPAFTAWPPLQRLLELRLQELHLGPVLLGHEPFLLQLVLQVAHLLPLFPHISALGGGLHMHGVQLRALLLEVLEDETVERILLRASSLGRWSCCGHSGLSL